MFRDVRFMGCCSVFSKFFLVGEGVGIRVVNLVFFRGLSVFFDML